MSNHCMEDRLMRATVIRVSGLAILLSAFAGIDRSSAAEPGGVSFSRDIRPILSDRCYACHGPDRNARKADLRLDDREAAIAAGAFEPGKPGESPLIERILTDDPQMVMPPPKFNKPLSAAQKELLRKWIADGARFESHWSLVPVPGEVAVPVPADPNRWIRNPIDAFVLDRLRREKLEPAEEAPREKWLRRASFDLTGLPPTIEALDRFLADQSSDACENAVDRLLKSPAYGERMANEWLDVARYADTFGYQSDRDMHMWPWRDWVIRAFNDNLPYNRFIQWQTAGDLLPGGSRDQRLATAFNRLHRQTNEGGSIEEEFRVAYIADRVVTNATAFLGLTFECARCHDHKYDPVSQADFYRLAAFFANIDEHGLYSHFTETAPTPALLLYEGDQETQHLELVARLRKKEAELTDIRNAQRAEDVSRDRTASSERDVPPRAAMVQFGFEDLPPSGDYKPAPGKQGQGIEFGGDDKYTCKEGGQFGRVTPFTFSLWVKPAEHKPRMVVLHQSVAAEDAAFRGLELLLDSGHPVFSLIHFWPGNAIRVRARRAIPTGEWTSLTVTYDGGSRAGGVRIYVNGVAAELEIIRDRLTRDCNYHKEWGDFVSGPVELSLGARFRDVGFRGGAIDELVVFDRELTSVEVPRVVGLEVANSDDDWFEHNLARGNERYQSALRELQALRIEENALVAKVRQIMVLHELPQPRPTHILRRGAYDAPGEAVAADTPASILPFPDEYPRNRLGLAQWLTSDRNPLVPRVTVNRFWQQFFGRGLVATAEDFGSQGEPPTHPELLDWLSRRFLDSGWNVKELSKLIVLSATYRQSSVPKEARLYVEDPDNRLLSRGPRHRLAAEQIRDNALASSGLLVEKRGGPSVMPYQPAGLWEESGTGKTYTQSQGEGLYRRSLYTFWRRTSPPPSLMTFDATTREVCIARRERTATPLQALVLLNDPQFVEAARVLAEKLIRENGDQFDTRLTNAFRRLTSRAPAEKELAVLQRLYREQREHFTRTPDEAIKLLAVGESPHDAQLDAADCAAMTVVVKTLMSFDECVTKR